MSEELESAWKEFHESAQRDISEQRFNLAIRKLYKALGVCEKIGVPWIGHVDTLEQLGYASYRYALLQRDLQNNAVEGKPVIFDESPPDLDEEGLDEFYVDFSSSLKEAELFLRIADSMILHIKTDLEQSQLFLKRKSILTTLQSVLMALQPYEESSYIETAKFTADLTADTEQLRELAEQKEEFIEERLLAILSTMLDTLQNSNNTADATKVEAVLELLSQQMKSIAGADSAQYANVLERLGERYRDVGDHDKAEVYFLETLRIRLRALGSNHASVAKSMREFGQYYLPETVGQALAARASEIESGLGLEDPLAPLVTEVITQDMRRRVDEFVELLELMPPHQRPFPLSFEQRYKRLISMLRDAQTIAIDMEASAEPLCTLSLMSELSKAYKRIGEIDESKRIEEKRLAIIAAIGARNTQ
jgi:hypothetical protein